MKYVRAQLDAVADGPKFRRLFENLDAPTLATKCKRGGKATNTATDDQNGRTIFHWEDRPEGKLSSQQNGFRGTEDITLH